MFFLSGNTISMVQKEIGKGTGGNLPSEPSYGEKGVRQFHAKDCSKILDIYKAGLLDLPTLNSEFEASAVSQSETSDPFQYKS